MTKFNKSLLTAAVVGALALPSLASAATLQYATSQQITFAKDLIVNNNISIDTPTDLRLTAQAVDNTGNRITNIIGGEVLTVKVTLDNGAQYDSTANAETLVQTFLEGNQTGGAGNPIIYVPGTANYNGGELNFQYRTTGAGTIGTTPATDYFLQLNSTKIKQLVTGLFTNSEVNAEITVQNGAGQQILAARQLVAKSAWGVTVTSNTAGVVALGLAAGESAEYIDVGSTPRNTLFGGAVVGSSATAGASANSFNAGGFNIDITKALEVGTGASTTPTYINNFSATASKPEYNIVNTAVFTLRVAGSSLSAFTGGRAWVDSSSTCSKAAGFVGSAAALNNGELVFSLPATSPIFANVTSAPPVSPGVNLYVCLGANNTDELVPQSLAGNLKLQYNLGTQRVDPAAWDIGLLPLRLNGSELLFQNVNPAANGTAQSFIRLTNNNAVACPVRIDAKDDAGRHTSEITGSIPAHGSLHVNSEDLENGNTGKGLTGAFGDGTGRWYVRVTAECSNLAGSALNRNLNTGVVTDLTPAKNETWLTPTTKL